MTKASRDYEEIAASIKRALEPRKDVKVVSHARIRDAITQKMRDFDILIEATISSTPFRIGVECRRKQRPVDTPQIEGFVTKLRNCRVDKGVVVSASGFTDEAIAAAEHDGIVCCLLTEVAALPWFKLVSQIGYSFTNLKFHGDVKLFSTEPMEGDPMTVEFPDATHPTMPFKDIGTYIVGLEDTVGGHHRKRIVYEPSVRPIAVMSDGRRCPLVRVELDAEWDVIVLQPKVEHWLYSQVGTAPKAGLTKIHIAEINGLPLTLEVTIAKGVTVRDK